MFKVSGTCLPCLPLAELYFKLLLDIRTSKPVVYLDANFMYNYKHRLERFRRLQTYSRCGRIVFIILNCRFLF